MFTFSTTAHVKKDKLVSLHLSLLMGEFFFLPRAQIVEGTDFTQGSHWTFHFMWVLGSIVCLCMGVKTRLLKLTLLSNPIPGRQQYTLTLWFSDTSLLPLRYPFLCCELQQALKRSLNYISRSIFVARGFQVVYSIKLPQPNSLFLIC